MAAGLLRDWGRGLARDKEILPDTWSYRQNVSPIAIERLGPILISTTLG